MKPTTIRADGQTDIVIDIGCLGYMREDSIGALLRRFHPKLLYGFDIHPALIEAVGVVGGSLVITSRKAAWTENGRAPYHVNGNCTHVSVTPEDLWIDCFDLAAWINLLPDTAKIVLKIDAEGAEYKLLPHLIETGAMERVGRLLVEWHTDKYANGYESDREVILAKIECPIEEWQ